VDEPRLAVFTGQNLHLTKIPLFYTITCEELQNNTHTPRLQAKNKQETSQSEEMDFLCRTFRQITSFVQQPVLTEKESHTHTHTHHKHTNAQQSSSSQEKTTR